MARNLRPNLPGAVFHLTARTQGHEPWFTELTRSRIVDYTAAAIQASDARLVAYAVMSNHLHLVVQQGDSPLEHLMQPLLRRIAHLVHRTHGVEGHVFERRYKSNACLDPTYARNAIVYANLNPVRAGLVSDPARYRWSSHAAYLGEDKSARLMSQALAVVNALGLFASRPGLGLDELRRDYVRYVDWRIGCDRHHATQRAGQDSAPPPPSPPVHCGDLCWSRSFAPLFSAPVRRGAPPSDSASPEPRPPDLRDIAGRTIADLAPGLDLARVRSAEKNRIVVSVRRAMVLRMSDAGYRGRSIARYLRVSDQCVSGILAAARRAGSAANA